MDCELHKMSVKSDKHDRSGTEHIASNNKGQFDERKNINKEGLLQFLASGASVTKAANRQEQCNKERKT